jgi:hypothetical protein
VIPDAESYNAYAKGDFVFSQANLMDGNRLVGEVKNIGDVTSSTRVAQALCFAGGMPTDIISGPLVVAEVPAGESSAFQISIFGPCETYIVAIT